MGLEIGRVTPPDGIDLSRSIYVGDRMRDIAAARVFGARAVLVRSTNTRDDDLAYARDNDIPIADSLSAAVDLLLDVVSRVLNFLLDETLFNGREHAAQRIDLFDVATSSSLNFIGEAFNRIRPGERIHGLGGAGFVSDNLLGAQGDPCRLFGGNG